MMNKKSNKLVCDSRGKKCLNRGQSMLEVLVAIAIAALIMMGVVSLSTVSVRNSSYSRDNSLATKFAQEAMEWLREERDKDWTDFAARAGTYTINCQPLLESSWDTSCGAINGKFVRSAELSVVDFDPNRISATVTVQWQDGDKTHRTRAVTRFTNWNR
jgi:prepilin-type N-terminal cleavage/methylation domain-containing protein